MVASRSRTRSSGGARVQGDISSDAGGGASSFGGTNTGGSTASSSSGGSVSGESGGVSAAGGMSAAGGTGAGGKTGNVLGGTAGSDAAGAAQVGGGDAGATSSPRCGDGHVDENEECDLGDANRPNPYGKGLCTTSCSAAPYCGDGKRNGAEICDGGGSDIVELGACNPECTAYYEKKYIRPTNDFFLQTSAEYQVPTRNAVPNSATRGRRCWWEVIVVRRLPRIAETCSRTGCSPNTHSTTTLRMN